MPRFPSRAAAALALLAVVAVARPARAAGYLDDWHPHQTYWGVNYEAAFPVGSLQTSFINNQGWLGGGFDVRVGVWGRISAGVNCTWNSFDQTFSGMTVERPGQTFTGSVYRKLAIFSARGTVHYYLTQSVFQPYVGLGVGGAWIQATQQVVNVEDSYPTSGVLLAPEAGVLWTVVPSLALTATARYQLALTTFAGVSNPQWLSGQVGIAYFY